MIAWKLDRTAAEKLAANVKGSEKLNVTLDVNDKNNITGSSSTVLPATMETNPFELSRLSLVVFDFDKADINATNKKMVSEFVAKTIHDGSTVSITGTTDAMGELDHNKELSTSRAFAVHKLIKEENGEFESAKSDYDKAISINPKDASAFYGRANCQAELGDSGAGISDLDEAIALNPKNASYYKQRGNFYYQLEKKDEACKDWSKALELGDAKAKFSIDQYCKRK